MTKLFSAIFLAYIALFSVDEINAQPQPQQQQQQAQAKWAVVRMNNTTKEELTLYYCWVWSNGNVAANWKKAVVPAGRQWSFWYPYAQGETVSPGFFVRFDVNRQPEVNFWEFRLGRGAAPDYKLPRFGAIYDINYSGNGFATVKPVSSFSKVDITNKSATNPLGN